MVQKYNIVIIHERFKGVSDLQKIILEYSQCAGEIFEINNLDIALVEVLKIKPDIIFICLSSFGKLVFDLLGKLKDFIEVQIIFIVSDEKNIFKALRYNPADFIMKPFVIEEIMLSINKAIKRIEFQNFLMNNRFIDINAKEKGIDFKNFLAISSLDTIEFLKMSDIMFCMAEGKYTTFFLLNGKKYTASKNLGEYECLLDDQFFFRVHHSYIVNMNYVVRINKRDGIYCELTNGVTIPLAKRRMENFYKFIKLKEY